LIRAQRSDKLEEKTSQLGNVGLKSRPWRFLGSHPLMFGTAFALNTLFIPPIWA
jgi:hypothetical protein